MNRGTCTSCGAPLLWARTENGRPIPLDPEPRDDGNVYVDAHSVAHVSRRGPTAGQVALGFDSGRRYVSHFVTCPQAEEHRKR